MEIKKNIKPRHWQENALIAWSENLQGIVHVVTGGGKTVFAYLCMSYFFKKYPKGRIIVVVPTTSLMDQWAIDIEDSTNLNEDEIGCFYGKGKEVAPKLVNIVVINTARHLVDWLSDGCETFLVVDECHRAGTPMNSRCLLGIHKATLGLSATPYRDSDKGFEEYLLPNLGKVVYQYNYKDAHQDGVIVDFELVNVEIGLNKHEYDMFKTNHQKLGKKSHNSDLGFISENREQKALTKTSRSAWAVKLTCKHPADRVVIFHERIESLGSITRLLKRLGLSCVQYHSKLSIPHRRDNLRLFRRGEVNILVTCRALDEGTNVPESSVAILALSTSSTRQRIQRLGRVLRPADKKPYALVYTLYYSDEEKKRLEFEESELEGVAKITWKVGKVS